MKKLWDRIDEGSAFEAMIFTFRVTIPVVCLALLTHFGYA